MHAEYGDSLRQDLVDRDGRVDDDSVRLLDQLTALRAKTNLQLPEIERTILKLSRRPKEGTLWARLLQRVAGWAMGLSQVPPPPRSSTASSNVSSMQEEVRVAVLEFVPL